MTSPRKRQWNSCSWKNHCRWELNNGDELTQFYNVLELHNVVLNPIIIPCGSFQLSTPFVRHTHSTLLFGDGPWKPRLRHVVHGCLHHRHTWMWLRHISLFFWHRVAQWWPQHWTRPTHSRMLSPLSFTLTSRSRPFWCLSYPCKGETTTCRSTNVQSITC